MLDFEAPWGAAIEDLDASVGDIRIHYRRAGSGPALVLLHGLVGSAHTWDGVMESLAREATVYAIDLPNMGQSEKRVGMDPGLKATADLLAAWMGEVGLAAADIAAHSHGGAIALMLAARHPGRVRKLVLFAPANPFCNAGRRLIQFYRSRVGQWCAYRIPSLPRTLHQLALARMYGDPRRVRRGALEAYTVNLNFVSIGHVMHIVRDWGADMKALYKALQRMLDKPTLLVWGDLDRTVSLDSSAPLRAYLPNSSLLVVPGVGHLPFEEEPQLCTRAMLDWFHTALFAVPSQRLQPAEVAGWDRNALRA